MAATREYSEMRVKGKFGRGVCPKMEVLEIGCEIDHENPEDWIWRVLFFCLCVLFFSSKASTFSWLYDHILLFHGNLYWAIPHFETQVILVDSEGWSWESLENQCDFEK